jgi:hypothetical protein
LDLTPDTTYAVGQEAQLVTKVVGQTGVVLVAWEHKAIARALLPAIANGQTLPNMPTKWDGTRFDVVLRFDRTSPEAPWSFRQLCPACFLAIQQPQWVDNAVKQLRGAPRFWES